MNPPMSTSELTEEQLNVLKAVKEIRQEKGDSVKTAEVRDKTGKGPSNTSDFLTKLEKKGKLKQLRKGVYDLPEYVENENGADENATGDAIYDAPASAGDGSLEVREDPIGYMPASQSLSSAGREVYWIPVRGDSMGDRYRMHSLVPVARFDEKVEDIQEDSVYHIRLEGAIQIKRLQRLPGQRIRIISDNDAYPNEILQLDEGIDFEVLGQVLV